MCLALYTSLASACPQLEPPSPAGRAPDSNDCSSNRSQKGSFSRYYTAIQRASNFSIHAGWVAISPADLIHSLEPSLAPNFTGSTRRYRLPYGVYADLPKLSNKKRSSPRGYSVQCLHKVYTIGPQKYEGNSHASPQSPSKDPKQPVYFRVRRPSSSLWKGK